MDVGTPSEYATDWFGWGQWGVFDVEIIEWNVDLASEVNICVIRLNPTYPPLQTKNMRPRPTPFYIFM